MEIQKLIERANQLLKEARYSSSRIYTYNWLWRKGILVYMRSRGLVDYDENVGHEYTLTCHDGFNVTFHHRDLIKSIDVLTNVLLNSNLGGRIHCAAQYPLRGDIGDAANQYLDCLKLKRIKERTLQRYKKTMSNLIEYLSGIGIDNPSGITERAIIKYIESREHQQKEHIDTTRRFLSFLFQENAIGKDYSYMLKSLGKGIKRVKAPSFYAADEVLLTPREASLFVEELLKDNNYLLTTADGAVNATPCPYCKTGKLVIRQHTANGSQFLGCSHYPSCNQLSRM